MSELETLPFVSRTEQGLLRAWSTCTRGDWASKTARGKCRADQVIEYMTESGNFTAVATIVADFPPQMGAIEFAFLARIAEHSTGLRVPVKACCRKSMLASGRPEA
jgi:hypothetical protein